ncbi:MAG TPA: hypothetical protein VFP00_05565 [Burkholderiales bacterium]|nr:hypothetical protein [Burkholderiales bacterium]
MLCASRDDAAQLAQALRVLAAHTLHRPWHMLSRAQRFDLLVNGYYPAHWRPWQVWLSLAPCAAVLLVLLAITWLALKVVGPRSARP